MKKLFIKRSLALLLDAFVFGAFYSLFVKEYALALHSYIGSFVYFLVFVPFFFKDVLFRNASIGKVIFGLVILDTNWKRPGIWTLIKRTPVMLTVGFVIFRIKKDRSWFLEWELATLKTRVVERKIYKKLKKQAHLKHENYTIVMNDLYNDYLKTGNIPCVF